jgi:hypothetical protein
MRPYLLIDVSAPLDLKIGAANNLLTFHVAGKGIQLQAEEIPKRLQEDVGTVFGQVPFMIHISIAHFKLFFEVNKRLQSLADWLVGFEYFVVKNPALRTNAYFNSMIFKPLQVIVVFAIMSEHRIKSTNGFDCVYR